MIYKYITNPVESLQLQLAGAEQFGAGARYWVLKPGAKAWLPSATPPGISTIMSATYARRFDALEILDSLGGLFVSAEQFSDGSFRVVTKDNDGELFSFVEFTESSFVGALAKAYEKFLLSKKGDSL